MNIRKMTLGYIGEESIEEIIMEDPGKLCVHILSYGAVIWKIFLPDKEKGCLHNVVMGFEDWNDYVDNPTYAGAALCPCAGRISQNSLVIEGHPVILTANDGFNNLHGGIECGSHRPWKVSGLSHTTEQCSVLLSLSMPNNTDGFPGNRNISIRYTLQNDHSLKISFLGTSDKITYMNLSNHSYFNLSGDFTRSGLEHELTVCAENFIVNDSNHLPTAIKPCINTPFDFSVPMTLKANMEKWPKDSQLHNAKGYNNGFLLVSAPHSGNSSLNKAAVLRDSSSGRTLTLYTDAPCLVIYSGGYLDDRWTLCSNVSSHASCAIALEAQDIPDAFRFAPDTVSLLHPGELFQRNILLAFEWNK